MLKFSIGLVLGAVWVLFVLTYVLSTDEALSQRKQALADCQKDLPRSQNCVLIAVPKLVLDASKESKEK